MIKKADVILLIFLVLLGVLITSFSFDKTVGDTVSIFVDGELYGRYSLNVDREINISYEGHSNNIIIKDGTVQMISSNCKNQVCVNEGKIKMASDMICCLPNKVLIKIESTGGDIDVVSK